jgi:hypothetical protein
MAHNRARMLIRLDVSDGSKADIPPCQGYVRFTPPKADKRGRNWIVRFVPILLQKSAAPSKCATFESNGRAA